MTSFRIGIFFFQPSPSNSISFYLSPSNLKFNYVPPFPLLQWRLRSSSPPTPTMAPNLPPTLAVATATNPKGLGKIVTLNPQQPLRFLEILNFGGGELISESVTSYNICKFYEKMVNFIQFQLSIWFPRKHRKMETSIEYANFRACFFVVLF